MLNITLNLITLSICGITPKNRYDIITNISLKIFDKVYLKQLLVYTTKQLWFIIIIVFER